MYCPILLHAYHTLSQRADMDFHDTHCKEGECAWWNPYVQACAIRVVSLHIGQINLKEQGGDKE